MPQILILSLHFGKRKESLKAKEIQIKRWRGKVKCLLWFDRSEGGEISEYWETGFVFIFSKKYHIVIIILIFSVRFFEIGYELFHSIQWCAVRGRGSIKYTTTARSWVCLVYFMLIWERVERVNEMVNDS